MVGVGWKKVTQPAMKLSLMKIIITKILYKCCVLWTLAFTDLLVKLLSTVALNKVVLDVRTALLQVRQ